MISHLAEYMIQNQNVQIMMNMDLNQIRLYMKIIWY